MIFKVFVALAIICGVAVTIGLVGMALSVFDRFEDWDWPFKFLLPGLVGGLIFLVAAMLVEPRRELSRDIIADKRHEIVTVMVLVGKIMVPQQHERWSLIARTGARCEVNAADYELYHTGDPVVCEWR